MLKEKLIQEIKDITEKYNIYYLILSNNNLYRLKYPNRTNLIRIKNDFLYDITTFHLLELQFTLIQIKYDANKQRKKEDIK